MTDGRHAVIWASMSDDAPLCISYCHRCGSSFCCTIQVLTRNHCRSLESPSRDNGLHFSKRHRRVWVCRRQGLQEKSRYILHYMFAVFRRGANHMPIRGLPNLSLLGSDY